MWIGSLLLEPAEEKRRMLSVLEGSIGASVALQCLCGSVCRCRRDSKSHGLHNGSWQQRHWAGVLAGNRISAWALGHPGLPYEA